MPSAFDITSQSFSRKRYVNTSREQLLMNLKDATDFEELKAFSQEDLLSVFCERQVY
jgi:hypothetical protein